MKKIISLFQRNYESDRLVRDELVPGAEWVSKGEGVATRKYDGTCCLVKEGKLYKRYELKAGRIAPPNFEILGTDEITGKSVGWVPVTDNPENKWHNEPPIPMKDGTYELIGPKIQGNPEHYPHHVFIEHDSAERLLDAPRTFTELREYLMRKDIEGIVWHHPDGRMVKIKKKDFGLKR